ncbi:hypothetical protein F4810DRAFT_675573 [Camillea tinctor]|nr:hypothetical protein F4810DRAFT_675573 [Camillea tinctor]
MNLSYLLARISVFATMCIPLPSLVLFTLNNVFEAYVLGKIVELHNTDELVKTHNFHFTVFYVVLRYVFGCNELVLNAAIMQTQNRSNNFMMIGILGGFVHIDDLADFHLRVAFLDPKADEPKDFGISTKVDYGTIFDVVKKAFLKAVAAGVFKRVTVPTLPVTYESSDSEKLLGRKLKSFESAVIDVASQYLEKLGVDKE